MKKKYPNSNEEGFALLAAILFLVALSLLGIVATTTTDIELRIAGNERVARVNFYNAEAAAYEAAQLIENETAENLKDKDLGGGDATNDGLVGLGDL